MADSDKIRVRVIKEVTLDSDELTDPELVITEMGLPVGDILEFKSILILGGTLASGKFDFKFTLATMEPPPSLPIALKTVELDAQDVIDGHYAVKLPFESAFFKNDARQVGILVRPTGTEDYTHLGIVELCPVAFAYSTKHLQLPVELVARASGVALKIHNQGGTQVTQKGGGLQVTVDPVSREPVIHGKSWGGSTAVLGTNHDEFSDGAGVEGRTVSKRKGAGVRAIGPGPLPEGSKGNALEINGGIGVVGAGVGTATPVFQHQVKFVSGPGGGEEDNNNVFTPFNFTVMDNALINGRGDAILIVTRLLIPDQNFADKDSMVAVKYDRSSEKWQLVNMNPSESMVDGQMFNVLVVFPVHHQPPVIERSSPNVRVSRANVGLT